MDKPFALIVEDDRAVAALFRHVMDMIGFQTELVFDGRVALDRLSHSEPDLVLLDLGLPRVPGGQIMAFIRKTQRLSHTKIVVITGQPHIVGGLSAQPDLLLLKPVSIDQLTRLISRITLSAKSPKAIPLNEEPLDSYTSLYNQAFFKNRLVSTLRQSREIDPYLFAILLFKVESPHQNKKSIRTTPWESILQEIAGTLRSILRPTDTIARFDSDTFYILIESIPDGETAVRIANRIQEVLSRRVPEIETKIRIPIRVGILLCDHGYEKVEMILSDARYAQALAIAQGDDYAKFYYQVSLKNRGGG
jgi:diguanylate cyclase (GGDEF)-like protein